MLGSVISVCQIISALRINYAEEHAVLVHISRYPLLTQIQLTAYLALTLVLIVHQPPNALNVCQAFP